MKPITENVQAVAKIKYHDYDTDTIEVRESDEFIMAMSDGDGGYYTYLNNLTDREIVASVSCLIEVAIEVLSSSGRDVFSQALMYYASSDGENLNEKEIN